MKKIYLLGLALFTCSSLFAQFLEQGNWRWRYDDGTQISATWKDAENTSVQLLSPIENIRLRLEIYNYNDDLNFNDVLQYATSQAGPWTTVNTTAGTNAFVLTNTSAFVTQDETTTAQLSATGYSFTAGKIMVNAQVLSAITIGMNMRTEMEWAISTTANTGAGIVYYFRQSGETAIYLSGGATYPALISAGILPVKITSFNVQARDAGVRIDWSTAFEELGGRFEIKRSTDGVTWSTIKVLAGLGSDNIARHYNIFDRQPFSGRNYYIVIQLDVYERDSRSRIKYVNLTGNPDTEITVSPNPIVSGVHFRLTRKSNSSVAVKLVNAGGRVIHAETISKIQANTQYTLNMRGNPAPGLYVLQLKGTGLSKSIKVIIE